MARRKKKAATAEKAEDRQEPEKPKAKTGLCQICETRPQSDPFIYIDDASGGKASFRFVCFECAVEAALEKIE